MVGCANAVSWPALFLWTGGVVSFVRRRVAATALL